MVAGKLVEENKKNQITPPDDRQAPGRHLVLYVPDPLFSQLNLSPLIGKNSSNCIFNLRAWIHGSGRGTLSVVNYNF
jgi:hypothetical protein